MIGEKNTNTAILYCSNINNKYSEKAFPIANILLGKNLQDVTSQYDYVVKTDLPQKEITTEIVTVSIPLNKIPSENIKDGKIWTEEFIDPISNEKYQQPLYIDGYMIPVGTPIIDDIEVIFEAEEQIENYIQNYQSYLPSDIRGYANRLMIDISTENIIVREKNEAEYLIDYKETKKDEIKLKFEDSFKEQCPTSFGFSVDCKQNDIVNWMATLQMFNLLPDLNETEVRDYNNKSHILTKEQYKQLCVEISYHYYSLFKKKWNLDELIDKAKDKIELDNISW